MIRWRWPLVIVPVLLLLSFVFAEGTRTWEQSKFEELIKGTTKGVAIRSTGGLELAPAFTDDRHERELCIAINLIRLGPLRRNVEA